jgi:NitT/TauT family transport system permease protein
MNKRSAEGSAKTSSVGLASAGIRSARHGVAYRAFGAIMPPFTVVLVLLILWQGAVLLFAPSEFLVPTPLAVVRAISESRSALLAAAWMTGSSAAIGFLLAALIGVTIGSILAASPFLMRGLYPIATLLQMVPLVAIAPLLVVWCGYGARTTIASAVIVSVFPVLAATLDGMRSTDPGLVELFSINRASRMQRWWKLELPWAIPSIVTGLRIAAGLSVIGAIVGEFVGAFAGDQSPVGILIVSAIRENRTDLVFAAVGVAALVGFALFGMVSLVGWLLLRHWHASAS